MQSGSAENRQPPAKVCPSCGVGFAGDALFCPNDGTPLTNAASAQKAQQAPDAYLGRTILDHIELRQLAGVGAMGRVYRAFQKGVDRDVAVKILHRELSANEQLVQRFNREAKVASRLQHPNVVHVHLAGQLPDGALYIAMEYLDGMSLQSALAACDGAMDLPRTLHIALQICDATGEAHAQGVVHRDLKPENVMLVRRGADADFVKVLDFGIARLNWGEQSMATAAGLIFGTARYISPEGAQGEIVGPQGDVYGLATLVYQMLSGRTPFDSEQAVALLIQQIHDAPPPLRSIARASYVPEPIAAVVMRNLAKDPAVREPDARAFGRALLEAAKASGLSADELGSRPMLMGSRPSGPVSLAPMQRTKQLELTPEVTARLSPEPTPAPAVPQTSTQPLARVATPAPAPARPSGVEITLDDMPAPVVAQAALGVRTQMSAPLPGALPVTPTPPPPSALPQADPRAARASQPSYPSARASKPSYPSAPEDEPEPEVVPARRVRSRAVVLFVAIFFVAATGSSFAAYKLGYLGQRAPDGPTLEATLARGDEAYKKQQWDSPPGDNVLDITNDGLARWPNDPQLLDLRERASDECVKLALHEKYDGRRDKAAQLAKLARELDPSDTTATMLLNDLTSAGPEAGVDAGPAPRPSNTQGGALLTVPRATLDATPAKPHVGQAMDVVARPLTASGAAPKTPPVDPELLVTGPGLAPNTKLPMTADASGALHSPLTLFDPGKFELTFTAKVDGVVVKAQKAVVVSTATAEPPALDGGKWM